MGVSDQAARAELTIFVKINAMQADFLKFVSEQGLFSREHKLLLALSGGKDSVCLFHLLHRSGFLFEAAHCNFGLRGSESDLDQKFVEQLCNESGIRLHIKKFDTLMESETMGKGIQETARILRYTWFESLVETAHFDRILTAHHRSDHTETMLINIIRSTGVSGLHGILPQRGYLVRPLMFTNSPAVELYLLRNNLPFRHDASNDSNDYLRNRLRNEVLSELRKVEPEIDDRMYKLSVRVAEFENMAKQLLDARLAAYSKPLENGLWVSDSFFEVMKDQSALMYAWIKEYGFNRDQAEFLSPSRNPQTGKSVVSERCKLTRERDGYVLNKHLSNFRSDPLVIQTPEGTYRYGNFNFIFKIVPADQVKFETPQMLYVDYNLCRFPLTVRTWVKGDRIVPLGMDGSKLVSDILTDHKTAAYSKSSVPVLTDSNGILIAVFPQVCSQLYRLTPLSENALSIQIINL